MTMASAAAVYLAGIVIGLVVMRDPWPSRIVTAVCWPLGVVALAVVLVIMVSAAVYLWPLLALAAAAAAGLGWILLRL
jgi:hypothetical protein